MIVAEDFLFDEKTLVSILLSEDGLHLPTIDKLFNSLPDKMFLDKTSRSFYGLIKGLFLNEDRELIGTHHFVHKLSNLAFMEIPGSDLYLSDISDYWIPKSTIWNWVKKIQARYFSERFKNASSEKEFYEIIKEKQQYTVEDRLLNISEDAEEAITKYEEHKGSAIFTSYPSIDSKIGSLQGGDMVVLAGASGGGKTALMLNIAKSIAKQGNPISIYSLEMPRWQLQQRIICSEACVDASKFRSYSLAEEDKKRYLDYANNQMKNMPIRIYSKQTITMEEMMSIERNSDSKVVFIDYLGLINSYNNKGSYEKYSEISRNIKLMAMETNKPVIVLHQLNRNFRDRDDKTPNVSDLRDSGKIEQDADMIWLIHRPDQYEDYDPREKGVIKFIIAKSRHGASNQTIDLIFNGVYQQILEPIRK